MPENPNNACPQAPYIGARRLALVLLATLAVILAQVIAKGPRKPLLDEFFYLTLADDLTRSGVFSDGLFAKQPAAETPVPGRFFAPAYPAFLAVMSRLDPSVRTFVGCHVTHRDEKSPPCAAAPMSLRVVQALFAAIGVTAVFVIAWTLSGSMAISVLAALLAIATGEPTYYARTYLSENTAFLGFNLALAAGVVALARTSVPAIALAGAALGFAALSRPSYLYLLYACAAVLAVMALLPRTRTAIGWRHAAAFVVAGLLVVAPWMARNAAVFGDTALSAGYGGFILAQRVAYNAMTWAEWGVSLIFWLPDFGDNLAKALFRPEGYRRLGFDDPTTFYLVGIRGLGPATLEAAGSREAQLGYLIKHHVAGDLVKHLAVTIPVTLRGIWAGKYLALAGVALTVPVGLALARAGRLLPYAWLVLALFFMAGLHGFVSVNVVRYNVPMIALYSFAVAFTLAGLVRRIAGGGTEALPRA